jgi:hypothetical protein
MISVSNALLILKGWRDEKTLLTCETELFSGWGVAMRCVVDSVSDDSKVRLVTPDRTALVDVVLSACEGVEYGEAKPPRDAVMIFLFPLRPGESSRKRDKLLLTVLRLED